MVRYLEFMVTGWDESDIQVTENRLVKVGYKTLLHADYKSAKKRGEIKNIMCYGTGVIIYVTDQDTDIPIPPLIPKISVHTLHKLPLPKLKDQLTACRGWAISCADWDVAIKLDIKKRFGRWNLKLLPPEEKLWGIVVPTCGSGIESRRRNSDEDYKIFTCSAYPKITAFEYMERFSNDIFEKE